MLLFFRDPIAAKPSEPNEMNLLRICDVHNIPVATNIATAEVLIHGLEHGDLDWRTILHPSHASKSKNCTKTPPQIWLVCGGALFIAVCLVVHNILHHAGHGEESGGEVV